MRDTIQSSTLFRNKIPVYNIKTINYSSSENLSGMRLAQNRTMFLKFGFTFELLDSVGLEWPGIANFKATLVILMSTQGQLNGIHKTISIWASLHILFDFHSKWPGTGSALYMLNKYLLVKLMNKSIYRRNTLLKDENSIQWPKRVGK